MEGERIRKKRKELGLSCEKVAQELKTTKVTVSRWEKGDSEPNDKTKFALARLLKTSVSYLIGEIDDPLPILASEKSVRCAVNDSEKGQNREAQVADDAGVTLIIQTNDKSREVVSKPGHLTFRSGDVLIDIPDTPENKQWFNGFLTKALNGSVKSEQEVATA